MQILNLQFFVKVEDLGFLIAFFVFIFFVSFISCKDVNEKNEDFNIN